MGIDEVCPLTQHRTTGFSRAFAFAFDCMVGMVWPVYCN